MTKSQIADQKYRKLFHESLDAIFLSNERLVIEEVNQSFISMFGLDGDQSISMDQIVIEPGSLKEMTAQLQKEKRLEEYEIWLKDVQDRKKYCIINCVEIRNDDKVINYLGVIRDLTKRRQVERQLLVAEKLAMTGNIARTIAHEVRNPLTNLRLALDQLKDEVSEEHEDADLYFNIIERNADRIGNLITDLLNSSKPRALKLKPESLNKRIKETIKLVDDRLKLRNIKLQLDFEETPEIQMDWEQLGVALLNLMVNAIEAMKDDVGVLEIHTAVEGDEVMLTIRDNGKGISPEDQKKLFEPFFTSKKMGTGLGLTTVQNIVHAHNGQIEVESKIDEGTSFYLTFPTL